MEVLLVFTQRIINMGATALLPFLIMILGLIFRMKPGAALKAGLFVGIGFSGLNLVVGLLTTTIQPISDYYAGMGKGFTTLYLGFAASGAASWTVPFAPIAVPLIVAANFILIFVFKRKVLNVDIWNYIHFLIPGALAYGLFGSVALGLGDPACVTCTAICIPLTIAFAFIIPDMTYFPIGVLTIVCYTTVFCVMASNGNLIRSLACSILSMFIIVFCANCFVPEATAFFHVTGLDIGNNMATDGFFGFNLADIIICMIHRIIV